MAGDDIEPPEEGCEPVPDGGSRRWLVALLAIVAMLLLCCICLFATMAAVALLSPDTINHILDLFGGPETATALP